MSRKKSKYRLTGIAPLLLHNGQLADPLNNFSKEIKKISGKRKKTDADLEQMAELEFKGSLYVDEDGEPILPSEGIEAIVRSGARKSKEGKLVEAGLFCVSNVKLEYDGPKDVDELWKDKKFVSRVPVKIGASKIMRTRPIFHNWACTLEVSFNDEVCNEEQVFGWFKVAGEQCGAFDWRPKHGRFEVERAA
jgi:hypothetical protein